MHRAANLRHLVTNIDRLLARGGGDPADCSRTARRAAALLRAYDDLASSSDEPCPCMPAIATVVGGLVEMFGHSVGSVVLLMDLQPLELTAERRRALVLAASELAINALRHAFVGRRFGVIQLELACDPQHRKAVMRIADDGVGPGILGETRGLGNQIVRGLAEVLEGDISWQRSESLGGTEAMLSFPLAASG
jgi:two-component sensor histidine kinase